MTGFAVVDLETTGFSPKRGDRVVEVGVVHVSLSGEIERSFTSLINPQRDVGPTSVHGISATDVIDAPIFPEVIPQLLDLFADRILVAHNMSFDERFLSAEFEAAGVNIDFQSLPKLCTMNLAARFMQVSSRSLSACCSAAGIQFESNHAALTDALATAKLLIHFRESGDFPAYVRDLEAKVKAFPSRSESSPYREAKARNVEALPSRDLEFVPRTLKKLTDVAGNDSERELLKLFDDVLSDGLVEEEELSLIAEFINEAEIPGERLHALQEEYFLEFVNAAWADGNLNKAEIIGIRYVGRMMQRSDLEIESKINALTDGTSRDVPFFERFTLELNAGDSVVLTGEMEKPRSYYVELLGAAGITVAPAISKKVSAVIAQDVNSLSGKARKARTMGIPIICIEDVLPLIEL